MHRIIFLLTLWGLPACTSSLESRAAKGDPEAQYELARQYQTSVVVDGYVSNYAEMQKAIDWYTKAAEQGHAKAQCDLGWIYENGQGVSADTIRAIGLYEKAAAQGCASAQFNLAYAYYYGEGVAENKPKAYSLFLQAAENGLSRAQCTVGNLYREGEGVTQNDSLAVVWYRKAALAGEADACIALASYSETGGGGITRNFQASINWYSIPAKEGNVEAQNRLASLYMKLCNQVERPSEEDCKNAFYWFMQAALQEDAFAQYNVGAMYYNGSGVASNGIEAIKWLTKAADQGYEEAKITLRRLKKFYRRMGL